MKTFYDTEDVLKLELLNFYSCDTSECIEMHLEQQKAWEKTPTKLTANKHESREKGSYLCLPALSPSLFPLFHSIHPIISM